MKDKLLIGFARVSTDGQDLRNQRAELAAAVCSRIFAEKITGAHARRPELARMLDHLRAGDVVTVTRLDRLARSTRDLLDIAEQLPNRAKCSIHSRLTRSVIQARPTGLGGGESRSVQNGRRPSFRSFLLLDVLFVITLSIFVPFAIFYMNEPVKLDYLWAALCILGAVYFIFRS